jgi:outer membrane murein-binding lipoprotein Lpp
LINFRYHVISIVAVFLALGLGMLIGAGVLDRVTVAQLNGRVRSLENDLDRSRASIKALSDRNGQTSALLKNLAPRVTNDVLLNRQVLLVRVGPGQGWEGAVGDAIKLAGAADGGSIVFSPRWSLSDPKDTQRLAAALGTTLDPNDPSGSAAQFLGTKLTSDAGPGLVSALKSAGFLDLSAPSSGTFPAPNVDVVVFAAPPAAGWLARFVQGIAVQTATLAVAPSVDALGTVDIVRHQPNRSKFLSTFDSAATDPAGVGCVLALRAAIDQQGGDFGTAGGLSYAPPSP